MKKNFKNEGEKGRKNEGGRDQMCCKCKNVDSTNFLAALKDIMDHFLIGLTLPSGLNKFVQTTMWPCNCFFFNIFFSSIYGCCWFPLNYTIDLQRILHDFKIAFAMFTAWLQTDGWMDQWTKTND